jgi:parallel beta-helix repeat protein
MSFAHATEMLEPRRLLTTYYVATDTALAKDTNSGLSLRAPLKTITEALELAEANTSGQADTVLIETGIYHEQPNVWPTDGGISATDRTVISAYVNPSTGQYEPVYIDAADPTVGTWTQVGTSSIWYLSDFTTETSGVWVDWSAANDGPGLQQIGTYNAGYYDDRTIIGTGVSSMYPGTYFGDLTDSRLYVWLADGSNPNSHTIEYANRARAIYQPGALQPDGTYQFANYVDFVGLNLRHDNVYNTVGQDTGCAMYTEGNERLIDCNIQYNAGVGVFLRGNSQMIDCISSNNGQNGVVGQGQGFSITGGEYDNNYWRQYSDGSDAGIKVITNNPTNFGNIQNAEVAGNYGQGIWFDTCFENSVISQITGNDVHDNQGAGIDLEASRYFLVANNVIVGNHEDGIAINAAEDAGIYNNTIVGNYGIAAIELDGDARDQGSEYPGTTGTAHNTIENNIIANNFTVYELDIPTMVTNDPDVANNLSDYNLFYRRGDPLHFTTGGTYLGSWGQTPSALTDWQTDSGQDTDSIVADPQFVPGGTGALAYQLGFNSPATQMGANLSSVFDGDYQSNTRPNDGPWDLGAFQSIATLTGSPGPVVVDTDPAVWMDDQLPDDASTTPSDASGNQDENRFWQWETSNTYSGSVALDSTLVAGTHRQYFTGADPRSIGVNDNLTAYVWIDPANPPAEIMLEWEDADGSWAHQAYWGANDIAGGVAGSVTGQYMSNLPATGQWSLLSVPAGSVGLTGGSVTGFSFDLFNGRALLDKVGNAPPTLNITSGTYTFYTDPRTDDPNLTVNVSAGATVIFAAVSGEGLQQYQLDSLNLSTGATAIIEQADNPTDRAILTLSSLTLNGLLDINDNEVIIHNGEPLALTSAIASGYAGGMWTGTSGITSTAAANDPTQLTAVGLDTGITGDFDGQGVIATDVELKYTYYGDTNLDGVVDGTDYSRLDNSIITPNSNTGWYNGDFNYDGRIDGSDYTLIDNSFNHQGVSLADVIAAPTAQIAVTFAVSRSTADSLFRATWIQSSSPEAAKAHDRHQGYGGRPLVLFSDFTFEMAHTGWRFRRIRPRPTRPIRPNEAGSGTATPETDKAAVTPAMLLKPVLPPS